MSQSDYIHLKRVKAVLTNQTELPAVLTSQSYTDFASFSTVTTVINTLPDYNYIPDPSMVNIFNMVQPVTCIEFPLCSEGDLYSMRENRVLNPANTDACTLVNPLNQVIVQSSEDKYTNACNIRCIKAATHNRLSIPVGPSSTKAVSKISSAQCGILRKLRTPSTSIYQPQNTALKPCIPVVYWPGDNRVK